MSEALDLSRMPAPELLKVDFEAVRAARITYLLALLDAAGIAYDAETLETDPGVILQESDAYREILAMASINDAFKAGLVAFATGAALDHIGATLHFLSRMDGETDERYRRRIQLESENKAGGRLAGYVHEALSVSADVFDVGAWIDRVDPMQPTVRLAIMGAGETGLPEPELVLAVQAHLDSETVRQATDIITCQAIEIVDYEIDVVVRHRSGPDPALLRSNADAALLSLAVERFRPGRDVRVSAIIAASSVAGVESVQVVSPSDIDINPAQVGRCLSVNVSSEITDG
jgi:phage-related baseplate assembly protein